MPALLPHRDINHMIGLRLRHRRQAICWTLKELAARLHVSHQLIQKYEMGRAGVSMDMLSAIAALMGVQLDYFFQEQGAEARLPTSHQRFPILMIEGDTMDALQLRAAIDASDCPTEILAAWDGVAALQSLRDGQLPFPVPRLILLGLDPAGRCATGGSGESFLIQIKQDPLFAPIPVVVLSHTASIRAIRSVYQQHAAGVVLKSDEYLKFKRRIHACLQYWTQTVPPLFHNRDLTSLRCQAA